MQRARCSWRLNAAKTSGQFAATLYTSSCNNANACLISAGAKFLCPINTSNYSCKLPFSTISGQIFRTLQIIRSSAPDAATLSKVKLQSF